MTSSNGTFSALPDICAGNSPVTGEFPTQRPVTRSFDIFFDLRLNKRLSKQRWGWWFETSSRHYDVTVMYHHSYKGKIVPSERTNRVVKHTPKTEVGHCSAAYVQAPSGASYTMTKCWEQILAIYGHNDMFLSDDIYRNSRQDNTSSPFY